MGEDCRHGFQILGAPKPCPALCSLRWNLADCQKLAVMKLTPGMCYIGRLTVSVVFHRRHISVSRETSSFHGNITVCCGVDCSLGCYLSGRFDHCVHCLYRNFSESQGCWHLQGYFPGNVDVLLDMIGREETDYMGRRESDFIILVGTDEGGYQAQPYWSICDSMGLS